MGNCVVIVLLVVNRRLVGPGAAMRVAVAFFCERALFGASGAVQAVL